MIVKTRLGGCGEGKKKEREKGERKILKNKTGRGENKKEKKNAQEFQMRSPR